MTSCQGVIRSLTAEQLTTRHQIRGDDVDGIEAVYHVVEHMSYHAGQIAFVSKQLSGRGPAPG